MAPPKDDSQLQASPLHLETMNTLVLTRKIYRCKSQEKTVALSFKLCARIKGHCDNVIYAVNEVNLTGWGLGLLEGRLMMILGYP